ncbi:hypothetical protein F4778DRAFT_741416 [Xylariomycetidae sp. FL2044]|nr:hypothetical protein F4778DRAFT_741416 [Xylariomycetidae sp. FL2044]
MSAKRKYSDFDADVPAAKNDTRERIPGYHATKRSKKNSSKRGKARPNNINWVKKRVRTIERRFKPGARSLPANVQHDLERELAYHKEKINQIADDKKRKGMIKRYHMVRFHERKKADRLFKQIRSQLEAAKDEEEIKKLKADLHTAEVDGLYARYFPHREPYVSLYPVSSIGLSVHGGEKPETASSAARALHTERPQLWREIERAAKRGEAALEEIRERKAEKRIKEKSATDSTAKKSNQPSNRNSLESGPARSRNEKGKQQETSDLSDSSSDSDSESDGGFFEEE